MLHGLGVETGVDLGALVATSRWMAGVLGRPSPSRVVTALHRDRRHNDPHESPPVYLHVGTPKSGTSYLQDSWRSTATASRAQGLDYPDTRTGDHFEAALDLIGERWAGEEKAARGQWDALVAEARRTPAATCWSATRSWPRAEPDGGRAGDGVLPATHEVHVVLTARDLGRQIPAEWQERVKHRGRRGYARLPRRRCSATTARTDWPMWFWRVQHLPDVLDDLGRGPAARARPPRDRPARRRPARRCCGTGSPGCRARPARRRTPRARPPTPPSAAPR